MQEIFWFWEPESIILFMQLDIGYKVRIIETKLAK